MTYVSVVTSLAAIIEQRHRRRHYWVGPVVVVKTNKYNNQSWSVLPSISKGTVYRSRTAALQWMSFDTVVA
jgi:hypothetical protein